VTLGRVASSSFKSSSDTDPPETSSRPARPHCAALRGLLACIVCDDVRGYSSGSSIPDVVRSTGPFNLRREASLVDAETKTRACRGSAGISDPLGLSRGHSFRS
jgi:hypothetical protein